MGKRFAASGPGQIAFIERPSSAQKSKLKHNAVRQWSKIEKQIHNWMAEKKQNECFGLALSKHWPEPRKDVVCSNEMFNLETLPVYVN